MAKTYSYCTWVITADKSLDMSWIRILMYSPAVP